MFADITAPMIDVKAHTKQKITCAAPPSRALSLGLSARDTSFNSVAKTAAYTIPHINGALRYTLCADTPAAKYDIAGIAIPDMEINPLGSLSEMAAKEHIAIISRVKTADAAPQSADAVIARAIP